MTGKGSQFDFDRLGQHFIRPRLFAILKYKKIAFIYFVFGSQKTASRSWLPPSTMWVLGTQAIRLGGKHLGLLSYLPGSFLPLSGIPGIPFFCLAPALRELCSLVEPEAWILVTVVPCHSRICGNRDSPDACTEQALKSKL